jgi:PrtD family type I secretion system ABC transporter
MRGALRERQLADRRSGLDLSAKAQFTGGGYSAATKFTRMFLQSAALGLGAWLAVDKQISAGAIIAASVLMSRALQPIEQLVGSWAVVGQARGALNNLIKLFPPTRGLDVSGTQLPAPTGALALEQVAVRAPGEGPVLLRGVSLRLTPGEILGVIGPSGAGKTTLARVAAGAISPDAGTVRLDGANLADWDGDRLGRYIGYVPQDSGLLAGSIRDNISRFAVWAPRDKESADPAIVDADVVAAAQAAGVHELILRLPKGYDTTLGAGGRGLSAGQAQRVALARALYGEPTLLILDEPNSALDADGEAALNNAILAAKARGAAILIVAHRTGILNIADRLLVLRDGQVDMLGPRTEVVAKMAANAQTRRPDLAPPSPPCRPPSHDRRQLQFSRDARPPAEPPRSRRACRTILSGPFASGPAWPACSSSVFSAGPRWRRWTPGPTPTGWSPWRAIARRCRAARAGLSPPLRSSKARAWSRARSWSSCRLPSCGPASAA